MVYEERLEIRRGKGELPSYKLCKISYNKKGKQEGTLLLLGQFNVHVARSEGHFVLRREKSALAKEVLDTAHSESGADKKLQDMIGEFVKELKQEDPKKYSDLKIYQDGIQIDL